MENKLDATQITENSLALDAFPAVGFEQWWQELSIPASTVELLCQGRMICIVFLKWKKISLNFNFSLKVGNWILAIHNEVWKGGV